MPSLFLDWDENGIRRMLSQDLGTEFILLPETEATAPQVQAMADQDNAPTRQTTTFAQSSVESSLASRIGMSEAKKLGRKVAIRRIENLLDEDLSPEDLLDFMVEVAVTAQQKAVSTLLDGFTVIAQNESSPSLYLAIQETRKDIDSALMKPVSDQSLSKPITELNLGTRLCNAIRREHFRDNYDEVTVKDLISLSASEILKTRDVGRKGLTEIRESLARLGRKLSDDDLRL